MGIRDVLIVGWCCGVMACQPGRGVGGGTIDDHDHLTALATVEAMGGRADSVQRTRHLRMLDLPAPTAVDSARADLLVLEIRDALGRYRDVAAATADGFEDLAAEDSGRVTHLVNWKWAVEEAFRFNPTKPSALVYRTRRDGTRELVGAMYTAPDGASSDALDRRVPVRIGRWHQHVDWCTPKRGDDARWTEVARDGAPMFGPGSRIATRQACDSVAGAFHPHVFGWMIHANVFASDEPGVIWSEPSGSPLPAPVPAAPVTAHPAATAVAHPAPGAVLDTALPSARVTPRHAAIVILPGAGGDSLNGVAEGLGKLGYVTRVVRYLSAADGNRAVGDAITQLEQDPSVDSTRIALVGVSLGGRLAILHAAGDPRVRCVVDYFGGIGEKGARRITRMPPVDIVGLEGDADVTTLHDMLTRLNVRSELHVYPGRVGKLAPSDRRDAGQGAETFLEACVPSK